MLRPFASSDAPLSTEIVVFLSATLLSAALAAAQGIPKEIPADVEPVVTTPSGLKYCVLKPGQPGAGPKFGDKVVCHYTGWNTDGSVFDSSRNNPKPAEFSIGGVIEGWNEALQMMTPGAQWKLTIPPDLGYGERGAPPDIKPNATLIFEVELISFEKGPDLPPFHQPNPEKQTKLESGIVMETLTEGSGEAPQPDDSIEMRFAIWNTSGRLIECSERAKQAFRGRASDMRFRVLQVAPQYMKVGSRLRFEVPAELCQGLPFGSSFLPAGSTTVWELELVAIHAAPKFVKPDPTKQTTTASGLKYEVLKEGGGKQAKEGDTVTVVYSGWLPDGTLFDSSKLRDPGTATFPLRKGSLIAGWVEGVALMKEGGACRFEIPGALAYGPAGRPPKIPANATLVFEIELVKVISR